MPERCRISGCSIWCITRCNMESSASNVSAFVQVAINDKPRVISMTKHSHDESFELRWSNLTHSYTRRKNILSRKQEKLIALEPCCGQVKSASVTAILGPSGAGKSTLLNCITGRISNQKGSCYIQSTSHMIPELKRSSLSYVPQTCEFLSLFSVRETLLFASRINHGHWSRDQHVTAIDSLLNTLDMRDKHDWPLAKLSGGQMKRVAIACPVVIVLDEPTSGLDADNAERLILHLKSLASSQYLSVKPAILLTIHSPSVEIFKLFDQIYILSTGGYNIYQGPPKSVIEYFQSHGFPRGRGDPAQSCIQIASGKYGMEKFPSMVMRRVDETEFDTRKQIDVSSMNKPRVSSCRQIWLLTIRAINYYFIKAPSAPIRLSCHVSVFISYFLIQRNHMIGDAHCSDKTSDLNRSLFEDTAIATMKLRNDFGDQFSSMNTIAVFGMLLITNIVYISCLTSMLLIILHRPVYRRELSNSWYSQTSYFFSRLLVDALVRFFCLTGCGLVLYGFTHNTVAIWRVSIFISSLYILSSTWENIASTVVVLAGEKRKLLELTGYVIVFELIDVIMLDFIAHRTVVNSVARLIKKFAPMNNTFAVMMISLFGYDRCESIEDKAIISVSLSGHETPKLALNKAWYSLNVTKQRMVDQLDILDVDEQVTSGLYDSMSHWMGPRNNATATQGSYILKFFKLNDEQLPCKMCLLFLWFCLTSFTLWYSIRKKYRWKQRNVEGPTRQNCLLVQESWKLECHLHVHSRWSCASTEILTRLGINF